jgi:hypothetical protein
VKNTIPPIDYYHGHSKHHQQSPNNLIPTHPIQHPKARKTLTALIFYSFQTLKVLNRVAAIKGYYNHSVVSSYNQAYLIM